MITQRQKAAAASLGVFGLHLVSWAALIYFAFYSFVFCLPTWGRESRNKEHPSVWQQFRQSSSIRYRMTDEGQSYIMSGKDLLAILGWWFPILVAALCAHLASFLQTASSGSRSGDDGNSTTALTSVFMSRTSQVSQIFLSPVPGRSFWQYWCGGLNVAELIMVILWITAHVVSFWDTLLYYGKKFDAWDEIGFRHSTSRKVLWMEWTSLAFAWLCLYNIAFLFLPISHNNFLSVLTGLPYSALIRYHRWLGHSTMWMVALHGATYSLYWIAEPDINFVKEFFDFGHHSKINIFAGVLAFCFGFVLWMTSLNWVRRKYFEVFYKMHMVGFIGFFLFAMLHYQGLWTVFVPGLALFGADYAFRLVQSQSITTVNAAHVDDDSKVALLEIPAHKEFSTCPVQDLFLMLPSISRWQWHPFTIVGRHSSTGSKPGTITVAMKSYGKWTQEAIRQLASGFPVPLRVTGALDGTSVAELAGYDGIVMLAGGIAATPVISLLTALIEAKSANNPDVEGIKVVNFIWASRQAGEFTLLRPEVLAAASEGSWLSVRLFNTGNKMSRPKQWDGAKMQSFHADLQNSKDVDSSSEPQSTDNTSPIKNLPISPALATAAGLKFPTASAFLWNMARPIQPKTAGPLHTAITIIVAFVGAFLGLVVVQAMGEEWESAHPTPDTYYKVGLALVLSITVHAIGLPMMLVVLPLNLYRYLKHSRSDAIKAIDVTGPHRKTSARMPVLQADGSAVVFEENGLSCPISPGRPDVKGAINATISTKKKQNILVICAGPTPMIASTSHLVWEMNESNKDSQVHFDFRKFAFEL